MTKKARNILFAADVDDFLSVKFNISLGALQIQEKEKLLHLEELLHQRVINQEEAISVISSALRRSRLKVSSAKKPIGSFLFLGPTGVGKTETAKALSNIYYGSEEAMLRFDMSQYRGEEGLERLIGSIKLGTPGELTAELTDHPFSLLLLDEFEKSSPEIYNLFLTLLDEGYIASSIGKKINAKNTIIIATSNAGGEFIRERLQQGLQEHPLQKALVEYIQREKIFSPELLNRFDSVVVFSPLSEGQLREVAKLQLEDLNERLAVKEVSVAVTAELIKKLATAGFDPQFGARAMKRVISEKIEDQVAKRLLEGTVKKGERIEIGL
jgi:ATP-dependent Clp protease ATP-binding subunit ClpC